MKAIIVVRVMPAVIVVVVASKVVVGRMSNVSIEEYSFQSQEPCQKSVGSVVVRAVVVVGRSI